MSAISITMRRTVISFAALLTATLVRTATAAALEFDHVWIVVTRDAPEHAALERAGLKISPDVNRHDGQGTASISAEFLNAYLELMWPDPTVSVAPGVERVTDIQLIRPKEYQPVAAFTYLEKAGIFKTTEGKEWAIEITFDGGRKAQTKDLRSDLPLIIHY